MPLGQRVGLMPSSVQVASPTVVLVMYLMMVPGVPGGKVAPPPPPGKFTTSRKGVMPLPLTVIKYTPTVAQTLTLPRLSLWVGLGMDPPEELRKAMVVVHGIASSLTSEQKVTVAPAKGRPVGPSTMFRNWESLCANAKEGNSKAKSSSNRLISCP